MQENDELGGGSAKTIPPSLPIAAGWRKASEATLQRREKEKLDRSAKLLLSQAPGLELSLRKGIHRAFMGETGAD